MKNIILLAALLIYSTLGVAGPIEISQGAISNTTKNSNSVFGSNLFNGSFANVTQTGYNPNYVVNVNDKINLKIWGAFEAEQELTVDKQGNIFIPKIGAINLLGKKNSQITKVLQDAIGQFYKDNVYVYANLQTYQPVTVFVSGAAKQPGLYEGLPSDSILQFIDKAKGISKIGSYRNINILRHGKTIKSLDLYSYLLSGKLELFPFKAGDIINIGYKNNYININGEAANIGQIELNKNSTTLANVIKVALPNPSATDVLIRRFNNSQSEVLTYSLSDTNVQVLSKDQIEFISNNNQKNIHVTISGEHDGASNFVVNRNSSFKDILSKIQFTELSANSQVHVFRKSIAKLQKNLITSSLKELEESMLTASSATTDESIIRKQEAKLVLDFIDRAKDVQPKGRVVINTKSDLSKFILEDGDVIHIPKKSHVITVEGQVKIPSALTFVKGISVNSYLEKCGGLTSRADEENILIIRQNGEVKTYNNSLFANTNVDINPGDSILVLGKVDSKNLQITKDITQILYQIAVSAGVLVGL